MSTGREFALRCPHCGEENPPEFPVCWSCHGDLPATSGAQEEEPAPAAAEPALAPVALPPRRKRIALEIAMVLVVVWLPWVASGIWNSFEPFPPRTVAHQLMGILHGTGILALIAYLTWLDGDWRRLLGLERPRWVKEIAWAAATFLATLVTYSLSWRISLALGLEETHATGRGFAPDARWLSPLYLLVFATVEEVFYRAYLWHRLRELTRRPVLSLGIASILFAVAHVYPLSGSLSVLFFGLTLAGFFRARPSLWPLVLAHWAYNLFVAG